jgi:3D (Asp-Asp-Asp) domain-containing protein
VNINENGNKPLVLFSELKPGDVFYRTGYDGGLENRYLMKIWPVAVKEGCSGKTEFTAVKLVTGGLSCIEDDRRVIPVEAELLVKGVGGDWSASENRG